MPNRPHVCVFCGSLRGARSVYVEAARRVGSALARNGLGLVYGGGRVGLMGIVADAVLAEGGRVIGVIPDPLATSEVAHDGLTELYIVPGMHERKALMAQKSAGFLTLPGGIGTFEEWLMRPNWWRIALALVGWAPPTIVRLWHLSIPWWAVPTLRGWLRADH